MNTSIRRISVRHLKPGMVNANAVLTDRNALLVAERTRLTQPVIDRIVDSGVPYVDILIVLETDYAATIAEEQQKLIKQHAQMTKKIKESFDRIRLTNSLPPDEFVDIATDISRTMVNTPSILTTLQNVKVMDDYTYTHSVNVGVLSGLIGKWLNYPDVPLLILAGMLHDVGKTKIPLEILNKPARLTDEEFRLIQRHAEFSVNLLAKAKGLPLECYDIALHHHERFDGSGYPHGLKGGQISFGAKMTAVCDVFDAITSERCYKSGMDTVLGLRKIYEGSGTHFCKEIARDFIQSVGMYPVGTCVVLEDGRSGVVVGSTEDIMRPVVQVVYDERKQERIRPQQVDLAQIGGNIASYGDPARLGTTSKELLEKILSALS